MTQDEIELFGYKCPYTDKPCYHDWECKTCEVELEEVEWLNTDNNTAIEICDNDCEHCEWATCPKMEGAEE